MDELAKLYVRYRDERYRIKVFEHFLMVERQPGGENQYISFDDSAVAARAYDVETQEWDIANILSLLDSIYYEME